MNDPASRAEKYFAAEYNCAQSVLMAILEARNIELPEAPYLAAGMGGGIARQGDTCGAISGAILAIGSLIHRSVTDIGTHKELTYTAAIKFYEQFKRHFGSGTCRVLTGIDVSDAVARKRAREKGIFDNICTKCVMTAVELVLNMFPE